MCGSATLAMVMSRTTMIIATITDIVIRPRCLTSTKPLSACALMRRPFRSRYSAAAAVPSPLCRSTETEALSPERSGT